MAEEKRPPRRPRGWPIRRSDIEPYTALRWVGVLFKGAAVFLGVAVLAEVVAGLSAAGAAALPQLLGEVARTVVLAVVLWGAGDLARLLIDIGHDARAQRVLLTRVVARLEAGAAGRGPAGGAAAPAPAAPPREEGTPRREEGAPGGRAKDRPPGQEERPAA